MANMESSAHGPSQINPQNFVVPTGSGGQRPLREYLALQFQTLLKTSAFLDALPGHLPPDLASQDRLPQLLQIIQQLSQLPLD